MAQVDPDRAVSIAIIVPCYNEGLTIAKVVKDFRAEFPGGNIFVYDNNSTDDTVEKAVAAGATVRTERYQGKGNVVRRMFADIDADVYVLVDGDDTYDPKAGQIAASMIIEQHLDFVNVARRSKHPNSYRPGHAFGNWFFSGVVRLIFGDQFTDMLSGLKVFSRRFVKSFPILSHGFEVETELTIHALELRMPIHEFEANYLQRPEGSESKLRTFRDGWRILRLITRLVKNERPLLFFGCIGAISMVAAVLLGIPLVITYFETGLVPRIPTAVLSIGLLLAGLQSLSVGLVLDTVTISRREIKRLAYLQYQR